MRRNQGREGEKRDVNWHAARRLATQARVARAAPWLLIVALACRESAATVQQSGCDRGNGGLTLPAGFCAQIVADRIGVARHLAVAPNGDIWINAEDARANSGGTTRIGRIAPEHARGGLIGLRDTTGDGRPDLTVRVPGAGGTGIAIRDGWLYYSTDTGVLRQRLDPRALQVLAPVETLVTGIPGGGHRSRSLAFGRGDDLFVNVGSDTNVCRTSDRRVGQDPCPELPVRAGIWRYSASRSGQRHPQDGERFVTGARNVVALAWHDSSATLLGLSHGRDALHQNFGERYDAEAGAELPAEEFMLLARGADFGWPYCYYDHRAGRKVQAPEYGGDGQTVGRCANAALPLRGFPGHWGPDALVFYGRTHFPAKYRGGAFIAFHGSWNRAPRPQAGYFVVFQPMQGGRPTGEHEVFAGGFAGEQKDPGGAAHRPTGLAIDRDGSLLITDDQQGRLWRVRWRGGGPG
jgi:glucose/arabinose dehydrogenase